MAESLERLQGIRSPDCPCPAAGQTVAAIHPGHGTHGTYHPSQTGEYATDEDEELSPTFPGGEMAIEVFELAENEDALSPVDMEPEKLVHKFKEVGGGLEVGG